MPKKITLEDVGRFYNDEIIQHNDNTKVLNIPHRNYNQALQRKFQRGAKQNAAWDKDHPIAAKWRNAVTTIPFAVAAAPFATAAINAGKVIRTIPKVAKTINTITKSPVGKIISKAKPYVNGTLALSGITHGVNEIKNTGFTPQAALDLSASIPFGLNVIKPIYGFVEKPNSFTRGIGDIQGLNDLIESGVIRGNPYGTAVTARTFAKYINHNRDNFNDIINLTKDPNIAYKYYRNQLTKDEFNKLKNAEIQFNKLHNETYNTSQNRIFDLTERPSFVQDYQDYNDYINHIKKYGKPTSIADDGSALAYYYNDGRNPLKQGHKYASSIYGVRINNASTYNPRIFDGHLHYSMPRAISLKDPNVEVFKRGPFGITIKMNKKKLISKHNKFINN